MRTAEYECGLCGQVASSGKDTTWDDSKRHVLDLFCRESGHPAWWVDAKCPRCGRIPEYSMLYRGDTDRREYPLLSCCGKEWVPDPERYRPNPFADEVAI